LPEAKFASFPFVYCFLSACNGSIFKQKEKKYTHKEIKKEKSKKT